MRPKIENAVETIAALVPKVRNFLWVVRSALALALAAEEAVRFKVARALRDIADEIEKG